MRNCALGEGMALLRAGEVEFVLGAREPLEDYGLEYCEMLSYDIVLITSLAQTSSTTPLLLQQRRSTGYFAYPLAYRPSSPAMRNSALVTRRQAPRRPTTPQPVLKPPPNRVLMPESSVSTTFA